MKKSIVSILVLSMMLTLVGCGGTSSSKTSESSAAVESSEKADATITESSSSTTPASSTDDYPTKPITDIVCTSAGGSTDLYNRLIANYIQPYLGQSFVVENVTGGAQVIGTTQLANSDPDGYTLGGGWSASFGMRPYLLEVTYSVDDFTFICGVMSQIEGVVVRKDAKWQSLDELMADLAADSSIKYGAGDAGSFQYVWARYLMNQKGVNGTFIPNEGDAGALTALLSGAVDFVIAENTSAKSGLESGDLRLLATCATERDPAQPEVPCLTELEYECVLSHTMSLIMPADVPQERVQKVYDAVEQMMADPEFKAACEKGGFAPVFKTGEEVRQEIDDLAAIIKPMIDNGDFD